MKVNFAPGAALRLPDLLSRQRLAALWRAARTAGHSFLMVLLLAALAPLSAVAASITVTPATTTIEAGEWRNFVPTVEGLTDQRVTWQVNGIAGGNDSVGRIYHYGHYRDGGYTAPPAPTGFPITITAVSVADPTVRGSVTINVVWPKPWIYDAQPRSIPQGMFTLRITGDSYVRGAEARLNGRPLTTTFVDSSHLTVTGDASMIPAGTARLTVVNPGDVSSSAVNLTVTSSTPTPTPTPPAVSDAQPRSIPVGAYTLTVSGSNFVSGATVRLNGMALSTRFDSATRLTATGTATSAMIGAAQVTVANPNGQVSAVFNGVNIVAGTPTPTPTPPAISDAQPRSIPVGTFTLTVTGSGFVSGAAVRMNGTALTTTYESATRLSATGTATSSMVGPVTLTVTNPNGSVSASFSGVSVTSGTPTPNPTPSPGTIAAARFLEQATFGPTTAEVARLQQVGINAWLAEQMALPETAYADSIGMSELRNATFRNMASAPDQLRQRMMFALSQIVVISSNKNIYGNEMLPYVRLLSKHAFGNYRAFLRDITLSPSMGKYLDLANSVKPGTGGSGANENYARELMQLFTIGLFELNEDGTEKRDGAGNLIPTYDQNTVRNVALALTGWTYPGSGGGLNWENFSGPLQPRPAYHETSSKTLTRGQVIPANQTMEQDLDAVIDNLMAHPNIGPFVATRLIKSLVTSNPSPAYVSRVVAVFNNNGSGVKGDLAATLRAILTDVEARDDAPKAGDGHMKDLLLHLIGVYRALGAQANANASQYMWLLDRYGQQPLTPNTVFSFYSPLNRMPGNPTRFAPEMQIYPPSLAMQRASLIFSLLEGDLNGSLGQFTAVAGDTAALVERVNSVLLFGRMSPELRQTLTRFIPTQPDNPTKALWAVYLTVISSEFNVTR